MQSLVPPLLSVNETTSKQLAVGEEVIGVRVGLGVGGTVDNRVGKVVGNGVGSCAGRVDGARVGDSVRTHDNESSWRLSRPFLVAISQAILKAVKNGPLFLTNPPSFR